MKRFDGWRLANGLIVKRFRPRKEAKGTTVEPGFFLGETPNRTTDRSEGKAVDFSWPQGSMGFAPPGIHLDCEYHQTGLVTYVGYPEHLIKVAGPNLRREWRILRGIDDEAAKNIMRAIVATKDNPDRLLSDYLALALGRKMAGWFIDPIGKNFTSEKRANIGKVLEYITDNLREQMTLQELASVANMSQSHFVRQFHEITGRTPHGYVREKRVDLAKRLLRESSMTTAEIALICGFSSQSHMTVVFKKWAGVTPGQFRSM